MFYSICIQEIVQMNSWMRNGGGFSTSSESLFSSLSDTHRIIIQLPKTLRNDPIKLDFCTFNYCSDRVNQVIKSLAYFWGFSEYTEDKYTQFSFYRACSSTPMYPELLHFAPLRNMIKTNCKKVFSRRRGETRPLMSTFNYCFK